MSPKANIAVVAALLVAIAAPAGAFAQSYGSAYTMPGHQLHAQSKQPKARVPFDAKASASEFDSSGPAVRSGGRWFETDPDPRIRFEMNRDDRDRRSGG